MMVDVAGDLDGHEPAQGRNDPAHGEDDESGDERAPFGLGPEALALHDQQRQDTGAHDQRDDVGGMQQVEGERGHQQHDRHHQERRWPLRMPARA